MPTIADVEDRESTEAWDKREGWFEMRVLGNAQSRGKGSRYAQFTKELL